MKHLIAFSFKFVFTAITLLSLLLTLEGAAITEILLITGILSGLAYLIGDLYILPRYGNFVATMSDFGLTAVTVGALGMLLINQTGYMFSITLIASFFLALIEAKFHSYMSDNVLEKETEEGFLSPTRLQTEFAEEENVFDLKKYQEKQRKKGN